MSNGEVAVTLAADWRGSRELGVLSTDLVSQETSFVPLVRESAALCTDSEGQPDHCGDDPDDIRLAVGPGGFVAEYRWQIDSGGPAIRRVAWSENGRTWRGLDTRREDSVVFPSSDGVYEAGPTSIERLNVNGHRAAPWDRGSEVTSAAATENIEAFVVEEPAGTSVWTFSEDQWHRHPLRDVMDGLADHARIELSFFSLVSSQDHLFLINLFPHEAADVEANAATFPLAWSTEDGDAWTSHAVPIAVGLAKTDRALRHVGPDGISMAGHTGWGDECLGTSIPCDEIPDYIAFVQQANPRAALMSVSSPGSREKVRGTVLAVTGEGELLLLRTRWSEQRGVALLSAALETYDTDRWFDIKWAAPLTDLTDLDSSLVPATGRNPGDRVRLTSLRDSREQVLVPEDGTTGAASFGTIYVAEIGLNKVEVFSYPDKTPLGTFLIVPDW